MKNNTAQINISNGWQEKNLGSIADLYQPQTISKSQMTLDGEYLVFGANGVIGRYDQFNHEDSEVIVTCRGASCGSISITPEQAWITGNAMVIRVDESKVLKPYIYYYLKNSDLNSVISGGAQPQITRQPISAFKILFPESKKEQQKIAEILGAVDEDIAKTQEVIKATEKLKRGLMQQLFTRGIGHTKFKETKIGQIPEEWEVKKIGDLGDVVTGNTPKTSERSNYGEDYLFVSPKDMGSIKYINYSENKLSKKGYDTTRKIPKGSVLVVCIGSTIGKIALAGIELSTNQQINSVVVNDHYSNEFIYYQLLYRRQDIIGRRSTQAVPIINKTDFSETYLALPKNKEVQEEIAGILSAVDEKILVNKKLKEKLTFLKKGLMQDLLSGKVRTIVN